MTKLSRKEVGLLFGGMILAFLFMLCYQNFTIVGKADGKPIFKYEVDHRLGYSYDNAVKNIAKDKLFDAAMKSQGISVSQQEIEQEFQKTVESYGGKEQLRQVLTDTQMNEAGLKNSIRQGILKQKAINKFADAVSCNDNEARSYYEENKEKYAEDFSAGKDQVTRDYKMTKGAQQYEDYIKSLEEKIKITIY